MKLVKYIFSFFIVGSWIGFSEFLRNELLFKYYWIEKYEELGVVFPSLMINNLIWAVWSFILSGLIVFLSRKLKFIENVIVTWLFAFVMMWLVIGNLNVLPYGLLFFAVPLSLVEVVVACGITYAMIKKK